MVIIRLSRDSQRTALAFEQDVDVSDTLAAVWYSRRVWRALAKRPPNTLGQTMHTIFKTISVESDLMAFARSRLTLDRLLVQRSLEGDIIAG